MDDAGFGGQDITYETQTPGKSYQEIIGQMADDDEVVITDTPAPYNPIVIRVKTTQQCDVDRAVYTDPTDLDRFGELAVNGIAWKVCGDCITAMWNVRRPDLEMEDVDDSSGQ